MDIKLPQIIGITGRKFNGKDTIGNHLEKQYGYVVIHYAEPIKQISKILFGFNEAQLYGDLKEEIDKFWGTSPRAIMQFLGTEIFRNQISQVIPDIENNFWVKCLEIKVKQILLINPNQKIAICDVRFSNEVDSIKAMGGKIIRVNRKKCTNIDTHESEKNIDSLIVDCEINNDSTLQELFISVDDFLTKNE